MRTLWFILSTSRQSYLVTKGGGGTLISSAYVGSGPESTIHPQKYQKFQAPLKNIWNFCNPKISQFCTLTLKKTLKCLEMTLKLAQFCDDPKKYPQNLHTPKNIHFSGNPKKILKFRILNPPKNSPSLRMCESIRVPPPPGSSQSVMVMKFSDGHLQTL